MIFILIFIVVNIHYGWSARESRMPLSTTFPQDNWEGRVRARGGMTKGHYFCLPAGLTSATQVQITAHPGRSLDTFAESLTIPTLSRLTLLKAKPPIKLAFLGSVKNKCTGTGIYLAF